MSMGEARIPEAFEAYEARLDPNLPDAMYVALEAPRWDPKTEAIEGKRVLVVGEQGIADELVFANCLNDVIEAVGPDGQVYVAVEARMVGLFQRSFPKAIVGDHKAVRLEGVAKLESGYVRIKRRTQRRPGLPRENVFAFWTGYGAHLVHALGGSLVTYARLYRMMRRIVTDPARFDYRDRAISSDVDAQASPLVAETRATETSRRRGARVREVA